MKFSFISSVRGVNVPSLKACFTEPVYIYVRLCELNFTNYYMSMIMPKKDLEMRCCVFQEMILDTVEGKTVPRYLVYDIIKFEVSYSKNREEMSNSDVIICSNG
jgi:hypothetical protein